MVIFNTDHTSILSYSYCWQARHSGIDYIVALLTGYVEPPAGKAMLPGLHYNPYFPGGAIAMAKQLTDGQVEYEDGTPSTEMQMAKGTNLTKLNITLTYLS